MGNTYEMILSASLGLFAENGYEAVSVSDIAGNVGLTKSALYKHFKSKRDIFDSIVKRMEKIDAERAKRYGVPGETPVKNTEESGAPGEITNKSTDETTCGSGSALERFIRFSEAQFEFWTEESFPAAFRRMLTLEQYRSADAAKLYSRCIVTGPLEYTAEFLYALTGDKDISDSMALEFYAPMFFLYSVSDGDTDKSRAKAMLRQSIAVFLARHGNSLNQRIRKE